MVKICGSLKTFCEKGGIQRDKVSDGAACSCEGFFHQKGDILPLCTDFPEGDRHAHRMEEGAEPFNPRSGQSFFVRHGGLSKDADGEPAERIRVVPVYV